MAAHLDAHWLARLDQARRATLVTIGPDGRPRPVPCCFARVGDADQWSLVTPIDGKPKHASDPTSLARVRDIERDPRMALLADRWDEDWTRLWWVRIEGTALVIWHDDEPAGHAVAIEALRQRYPQYRDHDLEHLPVIRISVTATRSWLSLAPQ